MFRTLQLAFAASLVLSLMGCWRSSKPEFIPGSLSAADSHQLMVETLADIAKQAGDENPYVGDRMARIRRQELANMSSQTPRLERWLKTYQLAKEELHLGNEDESIRLMGKAVALIRDNPNEIKPEILQQFYFDAAITYLRWGETQNCCQQNTPGSCIVPIQGDAIHKNQDGSRGGIQWLTALLQTLEEDQPMHLGARWLLNLAYMTLGEYPDHVPEEFLIPNIDANSEHTVPAWKNLAAECGIATFSLAGGAIADDFDGDSDIDLVVSSWDPRKSLKLFLNDGQGKFSEGTEQANLSKILGGLNLIQTDFNNDGNIDIFVMRGGWLSRAGRHPNSLLRNNGDGTFTDVTITAGLALPQLPTQTAAWADYDLDGDLDVYVGNESTDELPANSQLFRNNGDETFTDVTKEAGVANDRLAKAVVWATTTAIVTPTFMSRTTVARTASIRIAVTVHSRTSRRNSMWKVPMRASQLGFATRTKMAIWIYS